MIWNPVSNAELGDFWFQYRISVVPCNLGFSLRFWDIRSVKVPGNEFLDPCGCIKKTFKQDEFRTVEIPHFKVGDAEWNCYGHSAEFSLGECWTPTKRRLSDTSSRSTRFFIIRVQMPTTHLFTRAEVTRSQKSSMRMTLCPRVWFRIGLVLP